MIISLQSSERWASFYIGIGLLTSNYNHLNCYSRYFASKIYILSVSDPHIPPMNELFANQLANVIRKNKPKAICFSYFETLF